jgi:hypothetical protein
MTIRKKTSVSGYTLERVLETDGRTLKTDQILEAWRVSNNGVHYGRIYKVRHAIFGIMAPANVYWYTYVPKGLSWQTYLIQKMAHNRRNIVAELAMLYERPYYV